MKRNSNSRWYVSGLGVLLVISMSMLLMVGCSGDNPVVPTPEDPPDDGGFGNFDDVADRDRPEVTPPGFDKGNDLEPDEADAEEVFLLGVNLRISTLKMSDSDRNDVQT